MSSGSRPTEAARPLTEEECRLLSEFPEWLNRKGMYINADLMARLLAETERLRVALRKIEQARAFLRALRGVPPTEDTP